MKKNTLLIISILIVTLNLFSMAFSDPVNPPPPPPVTSYTYSLTDEFRSCGPQDGWADYCSEYYSRQKVVISGSGVMTENSLDFVCGKDSRCTNSESCFITNPNDNNKWQKIKLQEDWVCPDGYGLASSHKPGKLEPNFDTVSFSSTSIDTQSISFLSDTQTNLFFNSYIPACVNRIPMMNFNPVLKNNEGEEVSQKVGLYAKHETLSYDASPTGGVLENFNIPEQGKFREVLTLNSELKTYRMWSFRERFVEGLNRKIEQENLQIPGSINVDLLQSNTAHDYEDIYFSRDYMLGAYGVEEDLINNVPVGEDLVQSLKFNCNLDVNDLDISSIRTNSDLENYLRDNNRKNQVLQKLMDNPQLCGLTEETKNLVDIKYISDYETTQSDAISKNIKFDIRDISRWSYSDVFEFTGWANRYPITFSGRLRNIGELSDDPREDISSIDNIDYTIENQKIGDLDPRDYFNCDNNNVSCLIENIENLQEEDYKSFSQDLISNRDLDRMFLIKDILNIEEDRRDTVEMEVNAYTRDVEMDVSVLKTEPYYGFSLIELESETITSTESSWNWRSLESLTLTRLARCLYNWDDCLLSEKRQSGVNWEMSEVADLGYGPRMNSLAYIWSAQTLNQDYGLEFGYHFDGARGKDNVEFNIAVYKRCESDDFWISDEGYYACNDGIIYKCHLGLGADEIRLGNMFRAEVGNTIQVTDSFGYVCADTSSYIPQWKEIACY